MTLLFAIMALMEKDSSIRGILKESTPSISRALSCVWRLSVPVILAQITSIVMQYIDAAMVGRLGAEASASIGLVASSTWLVYGAESAAVSGFSVQVAHAIGGENFSRARSVVQQALAAVLIFSLAIGTAAALISPSLPSWLGSPQGIAKNASAYFFVFAISQPIAMISILCLSLMEASGNMKLPSFLSALTCVLDVAFNAFCIYKLKLGVAGAALGSALSQGVVGAFSLSYVCFFSPMLNIRKAARFKFSKDCLKTAAKIGLPMAFEQMALSGAQVASSKIVAPLGTVALAANSFGITAEALCYMPGYGIASAATTLVGQSVGADRKDLARRFSFLSAALGMLVMAAAAFMMFFASPYVFKILTPDAAVQKLATKALRIGLFAEPLFAASIVASGALRGAGDTLIPGIMNFSCMWGIRIPLSIFLSARLGLSGVWLSMTIELCARGIIFLFRLARKKF